MAVIRLDATDEVLPTDIERGGLLRVLGRPPYAVELPKRLLMWAHRLVLSLVCEQKIIVDALSRSPVGRDELSQFLEELIAVLALNEHAGLDVRVEGARGEVVATDDGSGSRAVLEEIDLRVEQSRLVGSDDAR